MQILGLDLSKVGLGDALEAMAEAWLDAQEVETDPPHRIRQDLWECFCVVLYHIISIDSELSVISLIECCLDNQPNSGNIEKAHPRYLEAVDKLSDLGVLVSKENGILIMDKCNLYVGTEWENSFHVTLPFIPGAHRYGKGSDICGTVVPLNLFTNYVAELHLRRSRRFKVIA